MVEKILSAYEGVCGFWSSDMRDLCSFSNRGGVTVYYARRVLGVETVCFAVKIF